MVYVITMTNRKSGRKNGEKKRESVQARKKSAMAVKVDEKFWKMAIESAKRQPRLAFYSPIASAVLNYWKNVIPRFSISDLLAKIVEKEIATRWPQLYIRAKRSLGIREGRREI